MRTASALLVLALVATGVSGQVLRRPVGWKVRFDRADATESELRSFVAMPPGWHITTGPAAIFWNPHDRASGRFRVDMEVHLFDPDGLREGFGVFFGGRQLEGLEASYAYFLIRDGHQFIIKTRTGTRTSTVQPWTTSPAVRAYADREQEVSVRNVLTVECGEKRVRFLVNGERVAAVSRGEIPTDGVVGLRVGHHVNVHVTRLEVKPIG